MFILGLVRGDWLSLGLLLCDIISFVDCLFLFLEFFSFSSIFDTISFCTIFTKE
jgi:hypothetical protein